VALTELEEQGRRTVTAQIAAVFGVSEQARMFSVHNEDGSFRSE
jgi:hypothetical protein